MTAAQQVREEYNNFAEYYDIWTDLVPSTATDRGFYVQLLEEAPSRHAVELGVGTGRVLEAMLAAGAQVVGVDISEAMLAKAADRCPQAVRDGAVTLVQADFVTYAGPGEPVGLVYSPYHTLPHVLTLPDWTQLFASVISYLVPGGLFAFAVSVPNLAELRRLDGDWQPLGKFPFGGGDAVVSTRATHDWEHSRQHTEVHAELFIDGQIELTKDFDFTLRLMTVTEVTALALEAGFDIVDVSDSLSQRGTPPVTEQNWILRRP